MERLPSSPEAFVICSVLQVLTTLEQIQIYRQPDAMTTFLASQSRAFFRRSVRISESKLEIIIERVVDEPGDADDEL